MKNRVVAPLAGEQFARLQLNGDRGFRFEVYFTPGRGVATPQKQEDGMEELKKQFAYYAPEQCRIAQVYFYLSDYRKRPLDDTAFSQMKKYLERLRELGVRAVVRFAYEYDVRFTEKKGPTTGMIRRHCAQIGAWFRQEEALVGETVLVLQAGLIGAWGEWHNAQFPHSGKKVLSFLGDMALPWMGIQVRTLPIKRKAKGLSAYGRIGYHDDYLVGENFKWSTPRAKEGSAAYGEFLEESRHTLNDGEMPWGKDKVYMQGVIDGKKMIRCCRERCLTTMSLAHNYREDGSSFNMERWKTELVSGEELTAMGCSFSSFYFQDEQGAPVRRSVYAYLRDHLGYLLELQEAAFEVRDGTLHLELSIRNHGFAQPHGFDVLEVGALQGEGMQWTEVSAYRPGDLLCGQCARYAIELPTSSASKVGLRLRNPRAPRLRAFFANDLPEENGVQMLYLD